ncbi:hypothetical protein [Chelatococcus reniformis]|uniref:Uncharacterized protein n=1 Tax=Chelatococcus reniformis TaxID=1494448 RepID=A0A916UX92_9HYPH|nr:hypothetical protein [Chelatococcus reniformis]GGC92336.1 hypothetical protein GCM10010994_57700 [Chelatococcus reniformis]
MIDAQPPVCDLQLMRVATAVRTFLEPTWDIWHASSERREPPSRGTCGRSSLFLQRVLGEDFAVLSRWTSGTPRLAADAPNLGPYGFHDGRAWQAHAWLVAGAWIVDVTADQFGAPPVIVAARDDPRYGAGNDTAPARARTARRQAVDRLWPHWTTSVPRHGLRARWAERGRTEAWPSPAGTQAARREVRPHA